MNIDEPVTLLTDYLLAALAGWLGWRLHRARPATNLAALWWSRALLLTSLSAFIGGSYHGFASNLSVPLAAACWRTTLLIINLLSAAMTLSLLHELMPVERQRPWRALIGGRFAVFVGIVLVHPAFIVAIFDYGLTMLAWVAASLLGRRVWRGWMLVAIALSAVAAVVQQMPLSPSPHFNHNDLYHFIQGLAIVGFYRAGTGLGAADLRAMRRS